MRRPETGDGGAEVRADPDLLDAAADVLAAIGDDLGADAAVRGSLPVPGFRAGYAADVFETALAAALRTHAARARSGAGALRSTAHAWRVADAEAAAAFGTAAVTPGGTAAVTPGGDGG
ncbi:hypothetical protein WIS52_29775 [Pseudonocardia nematodicida]|uniref:Uncharacterized protein n=1 Tax=Pseudonocardia nematodicida TaxID=1206997 RepID=A0ABV1KJP0_9PSEU